MSAQAAARAIPRPARPASPAPASQPTPRLLLVRAPAQARTRAPFVIACMLILVAALVTALLLNTTMARGAFEKQALDTELYRLAQSEQDLAAQVDRLRSPEQLASAAQARGMVKAESTAWLFLADGTVQGAPGEAGAGG
ncbi:hypothetical protein QUV83_13710 [Cellulomonas cellasea]|uniref:hypothetical protein n=1 Tax=Cellulomonas cellasea TaxID=43670 RepID=UPI0025A3F61E|nr:hypothetical protein [Cellulomonas cellasea]MDM8085828.1 hypothetical protein [Cellulomonas cellasea]